MADLNETFWQAAESTAGLMSRGQQMAESRQRMAQAQVLFPLQQAVQQQNLEMGALKIKDELTQRENLIKGMQSLSDISDAMRKDDMEPEDRMQYLLNAQIRNPYLAYSPQFKTALYVTEKAVESKRRMQLEQAQQEAIRQRQLEMAQEVLRRQVVVENIRGVNAMDRLKESENARANKAPSTEAAYAIQKMGLTPEQETDFWKMYWDKKYGRASTKTATPGVRAAFLKNINETQAAIEAFKKVHPEDSGLVDELWMGLKQELAGKEEKPKKQETKESGQPFLLPGQRLYQWDATK